MRWTTAVVAVALYTLGLGSAAPSAQEDVISPGGRLVESQVLNETLTARGDLQVYQRPERMWVLPAFWRDPQEAGTVESGERFTVIGVKETSLWRDRLVWLELEPEGDGDNVWFRIGPDESATATLWRDWARSPDRRNDDENDDEPE